MPGAPKYGGTLRVAVRDDPPAAWDTMRSTNYDLTLVTQAIAGDGKLVTACWDDENAVCPALAESWEASDDFTACFKKVWHVLGEEFRAGEPDHIEAHPE